MRTTRTVEVELLLDTLVASRITRDPPSWQRMPSEQGVANLLDALVAIWAVGDPLMAAIGADIARLAGLALISRGRRWRGRWGGRWRW